MKTGTDAGKQDHQKPSKDRKNDSHSDFSSNKRQDYTPTNASAGIAIK